MIADLQAEAHSSLETEYAVENGIVHISRLAANVVLGSNHAIGTDNVETAALEADAKMKGTIQAGKLCFQNQEVDSSRLESTEVEVKTLAIGLNEEVRSYPRNLKRLKPDAYTGHPWHHWPRISIQLQP